MKINRIAAAAAALMLSAWMQGAQAQEQFPSRVITIVNPNAPGGMSDIISRGVTEALQEYFKQPVVTTNRTGAGGAVGASFVAKADPDGYTVLLNTVTFATIPIVDELLDRPTVYSLDEFVLVARLTTDPLLLVVDPNLGVDTVEEFVEMAKSKPGEMVFSSTGTYSGPHVAMETFVRNAGLKMRHVPDNGAGPAITQVLGGHSAATMSPVGVASQHVEAGRVKLLATTGEEPTAAFDVPTLNAAGYDTQFMLWAGIFAPAATPPDVIARWQEALAASVEDPNFKEAMANLNIAIGYEDGPELEEWYSAEIERLKTTFGTLGKVE